MNTCVIFHSIDLDGWMSAAIVKHWFIETYKKDYYILNEDGSIDKTAPGISNNLLNFIGYNYGQPIPDLSMYNKVIMVDVSFPKEEMYKLFGRLNQNLIWLDHHISAMKKLFWEYIPNSKVVAGLRDTKFAACELTWKYFFPNETMPEIVKLLGNWDNMINVQIADKNEWLKVTEFQYGARQCISNYEEAYNWLQDCNFSAINRIHAQGKAIYQYLCMEAKQAYENGFKVNFWIDTIANPLKFICINKERFNPINFGIDYHKDGYDGAACFHRMANGKWSFSLYNHNGKVDCSIIAKDFGGGGHAGAAGFLTTDINSIIKQY